MSRTFLFASSQCCGFVLAQRDPDPHLTLCTVKTQSQSYSHREEGPMKVNLRGWEVNPHL